MIKQTPSDKYVYDPTNLEWRLNIIAIKTKIIMVTKIIFAFETENFFIITLFAVTPLRTPGISGLKSQIINPLFLS